MSVSWLKRTVMALVVVLGVPLAVIFCVVVFFGLMLLIGWLVLGFVFELWMGASRC